MASAPDTAAGDQREARRLLALLRNLASEMQGGRSCTAISLDSSLDRDLGFDSLTRVEMLHRIERDFAVQLPDRVLAAAETPRDLLREILSGDRGEGPGTDRAAQALDVGGIAEVPETARTLQEVLLWHVERHPERPHLLLHDERDAQGDAVSVSYGALYARARRAAGALQALGLEPGQAVSLMLPTGIDYFTSFLGILLARGIPVPIYPPARPSQLEDHLKRHAGILDNCDARLLVTVPAAKAVSRVLKMQVPGLQRVIDCGELTTGPAPVAVGTPRDDDIALLQYTSGSTGSPKGVVLGHDNLLANIRGICQSLQLRRDDIIVSWLPLYHDMGLIGTWLCSFYRALPLVVMSPLTFLASPARWPWAIHRYGGTLSAAPNFAFELLLREDDAALEGLQLDHWRLALNGAETVSPATLRRFQQRFGRYGFRPEVMVPVYGLAESAVGLSLPPLGRPPLIDRIQRETIERHGRAVPAPAGAGDDEVMEVVALGHPLPGHQVRIVDDLGRELPEREEGTLQFHGPSATRGYYRNPQQTRRLFHGEWLDSGDRGYIAGGEIYITGRNKDIIIRAGRNIYPHTLEEAVGELAGARKGCIAVFASPDPATGTERLVVMAETRLTEHDGRGELSRAIADTTLDLLGIPADDIVLVPPHTVPKTSSGKIRRAACAATYRRGERGEGRPGPLRQLLNLLASGLVPQWRRLRRLAGDTTYAGYTLATGAILALLCGSLLCLVPGRHRRWRLVRACGRAFFTLTATRVAVRGLEQVPHPGHCVVVANHASYLDGLVLMCGLPIEYRFVAKSELRRHFATRLVLSRLGAVFVERFDARQSVADAGQLAAVAASDSLMFFPEGTFRRMPGLLPFHMGAFATAATAQRPVLPVTLRGTRSKLRDDEWFPRRGTLELVIGAPLQPQGSDWAHAVALQQQARAAILAQCGEPDLAPRVSYPVAQ